MILEPGGNYGRQKLTVSRSPQEPLTLSLPGVIDTQSEQLNNITVLLAALVENTNRIARALERRG